MNNELEEFTYINSLLDIYKPLLTSKQSDVLLKYYSFNLSLGEISEELNITRSAVLDRIEHAKNKLINYEKSLNLYQKGCKIRLIVEKSNLTVDEKNKILEVL